MSSYVTTNHLFFSFFHFTPSSIMLCRKKSYHSYAPTLPAATTTTTAVLPANDTIPLTARTSTKRQKKRQKQKLENPRRNQTKRRLPPPPSPLFCLFGYSSQTFFWGGRPFFHQYVNSLTIVHYKKNRLILPQLFFSDDCRFFFCRGANNTLPQ